MLTKERASLLALTGAWLSVGSRSGTIDDMEHVVIFMQENRAFDHYYGTLQGVRGFNDRAAPLLPSGKPVWYQPVTQNPPLVPSRQFCGCGVCDIQWEGESELKYLLQTLKCDDFMATLKGAQPPVAVTDGELCQDLIQSMRESSLEHMSIAEAIAATTCPSDEVVNGTSYHALREPSTDADESEGNYMLPFPLMFNSTSASCMPAPEMAYESDIGIWNKGHMDGWNVARDPGYGMSYFNRSDLPFYYALADAFTIGDQYFQSTYTATDPNRLHLFSGSNGLSVNESGYCILDDSEPDPGFGWVTLGEQLEAEGISWKVIQEKDNFDDNGFAWFASYRQAKPGTALFEKGMSRVLNLTETFETLVATDKLPQVTILIAPAWRSEHATNHPADGEDLSARLISVLAQPEHKAVYAKTAFILNYDEGGQFVDHHWTPNPPMNAEDGQSTVSTHGELTLATEFNIPAGHPIGMGFRVPLIIISPWSRGNYVFSQVSDHTSVIQLLERRFGFRNPNISPWRRAVASDLTHAFDFGNPDYSWPASFPSTTGNVNASKWQCDNLPSPAVPVAQSLPSQETGTKLQRALPYQFEITEQVSPDSTSVTVTIANVGDAAAAFQVHDYKNSSNPPRRYTVEAKKQLKPVFPISGGEFNLSLHGPNGFVRQFTAYALSPARLRHSHKSWALFRPEKQVVVFAASFATAAAGANCSFALTDNAYGNQPVVLAATSAASGAWGFRHEWAVATSSSWYDVSVDLRCEDESQEIIQRRFMGKVEYTGTVTTSDPAMAEAREPDK